MRWLAFVFVVSACSSRLQVTLSGDGTGEVVGSTQSCRSSCELLGPVRAVADPHSRFEGWSGVCLGTGDCRAAGGSVTASFTATEFPVTVSVTGDGSVNAGDVGATSPWWVARDTTLTLSARPAAGWVFSRWDGPCLAPATAERCELRVTRALEVSAVFERTWEVTVVIEGAGEVVGPPPIGACASRCSARVRDGARLPLSTTAMAGHGFAEWTNGCGTQPQCDLVVTRDVVVTARFHPDIAVRTSGDGAGTVTGAPGCGGTSCSLPWGPGRTYQLQAVAGENSRFVGFVGCPDVRGSFCVINDYTPSLELVFERILFDQLLGTSRSYGRGIIVSTPEAEFVWLSGTYPVTLGGASLDAGESAWPRWGLFQTRPGPVRELDLPGPESELIGAEPQVDGGMVFVLRALRPMRVGPAQLAIYEEAIASMTPSGDFEWVSVNTGPVSDILRMRTNPVTGQTYLIGGLRDGARSVTYGPNTVEPMPDAGFSSTRTYLASIDRHGQREWASQRFDGVGYDSLFALRTGPATFDSLSSPSGGVPCLSSWSPTPAARNALSWSLYTTQGGCLRHGVSPIEEDLPQFHAVADGPGSGISLLGYALTPATWSQTALPQGNFYAHQEGAAEPVVQMLPTCSLSLLPFITPVGPTTVVIAGNGTCIPGFSVTPGVDGALVMVFDRQAGRVLRGWHLPRAELRSVSKLNDREFRVLVSFTAPFRVAGVDYPGPGSRFLVFTLRP